MRVGGGEKRERSKCGVRRYGGRWGTVCCGGGAAKKKAMGGAGEN